jgi:asparagine synthase (glutamine-hydrolysing)
MCGIAGFISSERDSPVEQRQILLDKMCKIITYRGPDEQGQVVRDRAALGMRRLSVIDLKSGQQPIYTEDGNLAIVFNGEIYNYRELKKELEKLGHTFKSQSDTEVVVHAYEEFGPACLEKFRGMFAIAIWNFDEESLFLARDRVGKKPLFYSLAENGDLVFGSELKSLLLHANIDRTLDLAALDSYLTFGYVPEEFCIFKSVQKLGPGMFLLYRNGKLHNERYWNFADTEPVDIKTEGEYSEALRAKIKDAVEVRLISEVPLGAFLSGGVDSSAVVGLMSEISPVPIKTFSIGFNEASFDELKFARVSAKQFGTDHHEFIVTPNLIDIVDELVWHFDEPFADSSALPTYMVSKLAREFVTVVLTGDGGDELFAGYTRYVIDKKRSGFVNLPEYFRRGVLRPLSEKLPHGAFGKNYLYNVSLDSVDRYIDSLSQFNIPRKRSLYSQEFFSTLNSEFGAGERDFQAIAGEVSTGNSIDRLMYLDSKTYLPGDILTKVDRMTMANSVEARAPLLDHELIELVGRIPTNLKLNGYQTKYILKKAMEGLVPDEILYREKQGFAVPLAKWINNELRERIHSDLKDRRTLERGYFKPSYIEVLLSEHSEGRRDHSHALWLLWMLELWHRKFVDGEIRSE